MKKYLLFALLICTVFALTACSSSFTCGFCDQEKKGEKHTTNGYNGSETTICDDCYKSTKDYMYSFTDGVVTINKYTGEATELEVPSSIGKYPVTKIGDYAFADQFNLKNVIIPQSVTSIGEGVFYNCNNLFSVAIPDRATCNSNAFKSCNIQNAFKYNVIAGGEVIITGHDGTATDVEIPSFIGKYPVTRIGEYAFAEEDFYKGVRLTSVVIPEGVKSIGQSAFQYCENLISVSIPTSVTNIGGLAFFCCRNLTTEIVIPHGVTNIERSTFYGCTKLTSVVIPASVMSIGESAFYNCGLKSVTIPGSVTSMGESAFERSSLESVTILEGVTKIDYMVFYDCYLLDNVTIPDSVTSIAFLNFEDDTIIWGNAGSYAQRYAKIFGHQFQQIQ